VEIQQPHGERFPADGKYAGENRETGGRLSFILNDDQEKLDTVTVNIYNQAGEQIRTLKTTTKKGVNRINWNLDRKSTAEYYGERTNRNRFFEPSGGNVIPGTYKVEFVYGEEKAETMITVHSDPRIEAKIADLQAKDAFKKEMEALQSKMNKANHQMDEAEKTIKKVQDMTKDLDSEEAKALADAAKEIKKKLETVKEAFNGPTREGQGIVRNLYPSTMTLQFVPRRYAGSSYTAPDPPNSER